MIDYRPRIADSLLQEKLSLAATGGERLYNGIELPYPWPPKPQFTELTREVQRVPYLENRPEVVRIDVGRQLFVDDFLIERTDLRRRWHYPEKYAGNPILKPETPLEINRPSNSSARVSCGGAWWDPKRKKFRLWYEAGWLFAAAYAESDDGLRWTRVNLDVVPGTNRVFPEGTPRFDHWAVSPDFSRADPYSNWVLFVRPPGGEAKPAYVATSKDGIHWSELRKAGDCGDASLFFYNPFRRKWVFSIRSELGPWGKGGSRIRSYREADDFLDGSQWEFLLGGSTKDVTLWLQPDDLEPRDPRFKLPPQLYVIDGVAYESLMLGGFSVWKGPENGDIVKYGMPKVNDLCFAFSRDGYHFSRIDRTPAIAAERWDSSAWDKGYVLALPNLFLVNEEKLIFLYAAAEGNPKRLGTGGFCCDGNGCYDRLASGAAILRRDGFASLTPGVGRKSGEIVTRPLVFSGSHLFVNADLKTGSLRAEVLDEDGRAIEPFTAAKSHVFKGNATRTRITWNGAGDLSALAGKTVRFRFIVEADAFDVGDFYAFWVSPSERGESRGYLGGGGPAYGGVRDL